MAECFELAQQELSDKSGLRRYMVLDVPTAAMARGMADTLAPIFWDGKQKGDVTVRELGGDHWECDVPYKIRDREEAGNINWSFNIATKSVTITHALAHVNTYPDGGNPHKGAIGVEVDGNGQTVKGCSVQVPYFTWDETHYYAASVVASHTFIQNLEDLGATCNESAWRIWQAQELLLLGISAAGSKDMDGTIAVGVKYRFASSRTKTNLTFGDITGVTRTGHNYLWLEYEEKEDGGLSTCQPVRVHTERIYELADWSADLPLPDPWN